MHRALTLAAVTAATALALTGCGAADSVSTDPTAPASHAAATPTEVRSPAAAHDCTVNITAAPSAEGMEQAEVACGEHMTTVAGAFGNQVTNNYDPATSGGVSSIVVVNGEARVWLHLPEKEGTCLIRYGEATEFPVSCEPTPEAA